MPKYTVAITEIVEYLVPVTALSELDADRAAMGKFTRTSFAQRVKWQVAVRACEVEGVNPVSESKPRRGVLRHSADL